MKKIYYEKVGRKYVPVAEYDKDYLDSFPKGNTLVMCNPGSTSRKYNVDPAFAPLIAAAKHAEQSMFAAMHSAAELRPTQTPVTPGQRRAWAKLALELGDDRCTLQGPSIHDVVYAGLTALIAEADTLLQNNTVRNAYDQFMLACALTKNYNNECTT
jgi:hypothetical protein